MAVKNNGHGTAYSTTLANPSAYIKKNGEEPNRFVRTSLSHGHRPLCMESGVGDESELDLVVGRLEG